MNMYAVYKTLDLTKIMQIVRSIQRFIVQNANHFTLSLAHTMRF
jgi:hypothetical protein